MISSTTYRSGAVAITIIELDPKSRTATIVAESYLDFVLAKAELRLKGLRAIRPNLSPIHSGREPHVT